MGLIVLVAPKFWKSVSEFDTEIFFGIVGTQLYGFEMQTITVQNFTALKPHVMFSWCIQSCYVVGSKSFRPDMQKPRQMENAVRDI